MRPQFDRERLEAPIRDCFQFESMSMLDHGLDVRAWYLDLRGLVLTGDVTRTWRLPSWIRHPVVRDGLLSEIDSVVEAYQVFHDCGKPLCRVTDGDGRQHFPDHAAASRARWIECSDGSDEALRVAELIGMDMDAHVLRADGLEEFCQRPQAVTLLLTALAEVHSNARMFGGVDSPGFRIKHKRLDRLGLRLLARREAP